MPEILMSTEGYEELKKQLDYLRTDKRKEISEKIKVALSFGDLSENSEYDEAKNEQAVVEARIAVLEDQIKRARVMDETEISRDIVGLGSTVTILDVEFDEQLTYRIASTVEAHHSSAETITDESPVGKALMGCKVGDKVDVAVPSGNVLSFEVLSIS